MGGDRAAMSNKREEPVIQPKEPTKQPRTRGGYIGTPAEDLGTGRRATFLGG